MPDYRTIPPIVEGVCRYSVTGRCCLLDLVSKPVCPPDRCDPPSKARVEFPASYFHALYGTKGQ